MNAFRERTLKFRTPFNNNVIKRLQQSFPPSCKYPQDKKPCFDSKYISIESGNRCHAKFIQSFLYSHYWTREPSVVGLWMKLNSTYLKLLSDKYSNSGYRILAFEKIDRTNERKLVGVSVAYKIYPWMMDELEDWAHCTGCEAERCRMYFHAHCFRSPDLFKKYNVNYIYNIEVLGTTSEVAGQGVGALLVKKTFDLAEDLRFPLAQLVSVNHYTTKICRKMGLKEEWSMDYSEFVNHAGQSLFFPRTPHTTVSIFTKYNDPKKGLILPCNKNYS